jgi:hypothetical protein
MHSAAGLFCSTVFVTFVLWLWMGVTGCRGVGFGSLLGSLGLGGLGGGRALLGSNLNRQFLLAALSSRMSCMNSLNSVCIDAVVKTVTTDIPAGAHLAIPFPVDYVQDSHVGEIIRPRFALFELEFVAL